MASSFSTLLEAVIFFFVGEQEPLVCGQSDVDDDGHSKCVDCDDEDPEIGPRINGECDPRRPDRCEDAGKPVRPVDRSMYFYPDADISIPTFDGGTLELRRFYDSRAARGDYGKTRAEKIVEMSWRRINLGYVASASGIRRIVHDDEPVILTVVGTGYIETDATTLENSGYKIDGAVESSPLRLLDASLRWQRHRCEWNDRYPSPELD